MKKYLFVFLILLINCASVYADDAADALLFKVNDAYSAVKSFQLTTETALTMDNGETSGSIVTTVKTTLIRNPYVSYMENSLRSGESLQSFIVYFIAQKNETLILSYYDAKWQTDSIDTKQFESLKHKIAPEATVEMFIGLSADFSISSDQERVNGQPVYTIAGQIYGENLQAVLDYSGILSTLPNSDSPTTPNNIPIQVRIQIGQADFLPYHIEVDATAYLQKIVQDNRAEGTQDLTQYHFSADFSNFNAVEKIEIPTGI